MVEAILPRRTVFMRQAAGERAEPQAIAANIDRVFVVTASVGDFNVRRVERYLVAIAAGGAEGQIVLTKADLVTDIHHTAELCHCFAEMHAHIEGTHRHWHDHDPGLSAESLGDGADEVPTKDVP